MMQILIYARVIFINRAGTKTADKDTRAVLYPAARAYVARNQ